MMERVNWRERYPDEVTCVRCLEVKPVQDLDRLLWCEECLGTAKRRAAIRGWIGGAVVMLLLAAYIALVVQPDLSLIPSAWLATLAVAFYLGGRIARELFFGWERLKNRPAMEASPPDLGTPPGGSPPDADPSR